MNINDDYTLLSEYLGIGKKLTDAGVFDCYIKQDSKFFVNILLLKTTKIPEFKNSYNKINSFFNDLVTLLLSADSKDMENRFFSEAVNKFQFNEYKELNLGFSESKGGSGFGGKLSEKTIRDAFDIIKKGNEKPELFHLVGLFEDNVGPDRISDMICGIINDDIEKYTKRIFKQLYINSNSCKNVKFDSKGYIVNPKNNGRLLLIPSSLLQNLPIMDSWEDADEVFSKNRLIRSIINRIIGNTWEKKKSEERKLFIKDNIFSNKKLCEELIEEYKKTTTEPIDVDSDYVYNLPKSWKELVKYNFKTKNKRINTLNASIEIIGIFKDWVENNGGWKDIRNQKSSNREKYVQHLILLSSKYYARINNVDISPETNKGNGLADFKVSCGENDKTVIEIKLSTNSQYLHGYESQIRDYAKSEGTDKMVYCYLDLGDNDARLSKLIETNRNDIENTKIYPELMLINTKEKLSASKKQKNTKK